MKGHDIWLTVETKCLLALSAQTYRERRSNYIGWYLRDVFCRLKEALDSVQAMARKRGRYFQTAVMNSLIRALAPEYVHRALQTLATLRREGLRIQRDTYVALIQACTQESLIDIARELYWYVSHQCRVSIPAS